MGCNTHVHGSNARIFSVQQFSLSQTSKGAMSFLLSPMFSLQQIREQEGVTGSGSR
jgi:hypothetical protein